MLHLKMQLLKDLYIEEKEKNAIHKNTCILNLKPDKMQIFFFYIIIIIICLSVCLFLFWSLLSDLTLSFRRYAWWILDCEWNTGKSIFYNSDSRWSEMMTKTQYKAFNQLWKKCFSFINFFMYFLVLSPQQSNYM
jgi:hypothetical protein